MVRSLLEIRPSVKIDGARQVGKSTMVAKICEDLGGEYLTLDDLGTMRAFQRDPRKMIEEHSDRLVVLDELQQIPGLIRQVKHHIDMHRRPGMFILTGSADRFRSSEDSRPLTGRGRTLFMRPLSQLEIEGKAGTINVVDKMFGKDQPPDFDCHGLGERIRHGGYPIAVFNPVEMNDFFESYIHDELMNNLIRMRSSENLPLIPEVLQKLAKKQGKIINVSELATEIKNTVKVTRALVELLERTYLLETLPSYPFPMRSKPTTRKTKIYLNDSGLVFNLRKLDGRELTGGDLGTLLEVFVLSELRKGLACSSLFGTGEIYYYHEHNGIEVDFVINKGPDEENVAVEVKASESLKIRDWKNLAKFKEISGAKCKRCILLYGGSKVQDLAKGIEAWPISCLWAWK